MNRLTKQYGNGNWTLDASKFPPIDQTVLDSEIRNSEPIRAAVERLAEYEDAEEKGLFERLPCKVGDTVWLAEPMYYSCDEPECAVVEHFNIYSKRITVTIYIDPDTYKEVDLEDIFLTPEEAEQALKARESK